METTLRTIRVTASVAFDKTWSGLVAVVADVPDERLSEVGLMVGSYVCEEKFEPTGHRTVRAADVVPAAATDGHVPLVAYADRHGALTVTALPRGVNPLAFVRRLAVDGDPETAALAVKAAGLFAEVCRLDGYAFTGLDKNLLAAHLGTRFGVPPAAVYPEYQEV